MSEFLSPELDGIDLLDDLCFAIEARACGQSGAHHIAEIKAELIRRLSRADDAIHPIDAAKVNERIRALMSSNADLAEAAYAVLSNEEHAVSAGIHTYQVGSQTWQVYQDLRDAADKATKGEP